MQRLTKKYSTAIKTAKDLSIKNFNNSDELYRELIKAGYTWEKDKANWIRNKQQAEPPTDLIKIRIWSSEATIDLFANTVARQLEQKLDWKLVDKSDPYLCRPPKQLEARVYLTFQPRL